MKSWLSAASLALALLAWNGVARAVPVIGDESSVSLVIDTSSLGISVTPMGSTTIDPLGRYVLPITGGDVTLHPLAGSIQHDGSGLSLDRSGSTLTFQNLNVDFTSGIVSGDVGGTGSTGNMDLFTIQSCAAGDCTDGHGGIPVTETGLFLRDNGASLVNGLFSSPIVATGDQIGLAEIHLRLEDGNSVPEPALLLLLGGSLAAVALVRRKA
ncbi:MAG TPA: PEP-CTERM sorting domain-containing protein [Myxococcota bacterium]|nr:PEP-CTERM sorting domain-containing protein [Myxococcota bacterium]